MLALRLPHRERASRMIDAHIQLPHHVPADDPVDLCVSQAPAGGRIGNAEIAAPHQHGGCVAPVERPDMQRGHQSGQHAHAAERGDRLERIRRARRDAGSARHIRRDHRHARAGVEPEEKSLSVDFNRQHRHADRREYDRENCRIRAESRMRRAGTRKRRGPRLDTGQIRTVALNPGHNRQRRKLPPAVLGVEHPSQHDHRNAPHGAVRVRAAREGVERSDCRRGVARNHPVQRDGELFLIVRMPGSRGEQCMIEIEPRDEIPVVARSASCDRGTLVRRHMRAPGHRCSHACSEKDGSRPQPGQQRRQSTRVMS